MSNDREKLQMYADGYDSGLYTKLESRGGMLEILERSPDFIGLWTNLPEWAQLDIWMFLKECDETTVLYGFYSLNGETIAPQLIELKNWINTNNVYGDEDG